MPKIGLLEAEINGNNQIYRQLNLANFNLALIPHAHFGNWNWNVEHQGAVSSLIGHDFQAVIDAEKIKDYCMDFKKGMLDGITPNSQNLTNTKTFITNLLIFGKNIPSNLSNIGLLSLSGVFLTAKNSIILVDYGWTCDNPDFSDVNFPLDWIHDGKQIEIAKNENVQTDYNQKTIARFVAYILTGDEKNAKDKDFFKSASPESQAVWQKIVEAQTSHVTDFFNIELNVNDLFTPLPSQKIKRALSKTSKVILISCLLIIFAVLFLKNYPPVVEKVNKIIEIVKIWIEGTVPPPPPPPHEPEEQLKRLRKVYLDNEKMLEGNVFERTDAIKKIKEALENNPKAKDALDGLQFVNWINTKISQ